jgi:tRNA threonylcarbamoyladenosine biosynthesis protein TsaE
MTWPLTYMSDSPAATKALAGRLAVLCGSGDVVLLIGDLGAGKTAFAQGFAAALGVAGPVTSPTFTLIRHYECVGAGSIDTLMHADVYRTGSLHEVIDLALAELVEERAVALIEWGDMAAPAVGPDTLRVTLVVPKGATSPEERRITITGEGTWATRADEVDRALSGSPAAAPGVVSG